MASFGHVAVGLLTGRLHGGGGEGKNGGPEGDGGGKPRRPCSWPALLLFVALALLPDADVALVALGACDDGACGHRGASHSLPFAIAIGLLAGLAARRLRWPVVRTVVAATFAVASHAMLDALGAGGRGLPLLWPFSDARFISPIRIFPDAPRGSGAAVDSGRHQRGHRVRGLPADDAVRDVAADHGPAVRRRRRPRDPEAVPD